MLRFLRSVWRPYLTYTRPAFSGIANALERLQ